MSKYTTEVRFICEEGAGLDHSEGYKSINQIITDAMPKVFDFEFPIFDETYRPVLERKILKHYYTREIGMETVGMWKHFLDMRLNEIMPYYNKLYESELLQFNPLYDVDLTTDHSGSGTSASKGHKSDAENTHNTRTDNLTKIDDLTRIDNLTRTDNFTRTDDLTEGLSATRTDNLLETSDNTRTDNLSKVTQDSGTQGESGSDVNKNTRWDIYSDTPQGSLTNVQNETYLTNARKIIDDGTGSTHSSTTTFGKKVTETDTGTVGDSGTVANTGTVQNSETKTNTGTEKNTGTQTNTGTQKHTGTVKNTGNAQSVGSRNQTIGTTEDISTTDEYLNHVIGKTGGTSYSRLLAEYRETFLNIDMLIIEDLSDLFMQLW